MTLPLKPDAALAEIGRAAKLLDSVRSLPQAVEVRSRAAALEAYARAQKSDEILSLAQEVRLRSERRAGGFLLRMKEDGELGVGRPRPNATTLAELRVDEHDSKRWQLVARIPLEDFEEYVRTAWVKTRAGLFRMAEKEYAPPAPRAEDAAPPGGEMASRAEDLYRGMTCACSCECCTRRGEHKPPAPVAGRWGALA